MRLGLGLGIGVGGGAPPAAPTFSDITGIFLHYSTSYGTSDATKWTPRTGTGDCTQGTANLRPVITAGAIGGRPAYRLTNSPLTHWLLPVLSSLTAAHMFVVVYPDADPGIGGGTWWKLGNPGTTDHTPFTDGVIYDSAGSTARKTVGNPTPSLAAPHVYDVISVSGEWTANLDGAQLFTTATNTVGWSATPTIGSTGNPMNGYVGDVVIFDRKLTTDLATVRARLKAWFGTP